MMDRCSDFMLFSAGLELSLSLCSESVVFALFEGRSIFNGLLSLLLLS